VNIDKIGQKWFKIQKPKFGLKNQKWSGFIKNRMIFLVFDRKFNFQISEKKTVNCSIFWKTEQFFFQKCQQSYMQLMQQLKAIPEN
jgi:hypothetical protein